MEKPVKKEKKGKQLTYRAETDLVQRLNELSLKEDIPQATLVRRFLRAAIELYDKYGSWHEMKNAVSTITMELNSHAGKTNQHGTKEELFDDQVEQQPEKAREGRTGAKGQREKPKQKNYRSKAS